MGNVVGRQRGSHTLNQGDHEPRSETSGRNARTQSEPRSRGQTRGQNIPRSQSETRESTASDEGSRSKLGCFGRRKKKAVKPQESSGRDSLDHDHSTPRCIDCEGRGRSHSGGRNSFSDGITIYGRRSSTGSEFDIRRDHNADKEQLEPIVPFLPDDKGYALLLGTKRGKIGSLCSRHTQKELTKSLRNQVLDSLKVISNMIDNDQEPPRSMMLLGKVGDSDPGWVNIMISLISFVPPHESLGPAVINLLVDECPLPTREAVQLLYERLRFSADNPSDAEAGGEGKHWTRVPDCSPATQRNLCIMLGSLAEKMADCSPATQRNLCIMLGSLAEKMAGPNCLRLLTESILDYLFSNLTADHSDPALSLFSLIALEKFSLTSESKLLIMNKLQDDESLVNLEKAYLQQQKLKPDLDSPDLDLDLYYYRRQVGFCAQWCLDNLLVPKDRVYTYQSPDLDTTGINVMLNSQDVSEYLKLSPDGLEARCDAILFESVRCTFEVDSGVWYYEAEIVTPGVMQIGWATKDSKFLNYEGYGIGDDEFSIAYDGCRQLIWYGAKSEKHNHEPWRPGDVLGALLDADNMNVMFTLNGVPLPVLDHLTRSPSLRSGVGYFAAASFMSYQQCRFNFGAEPFRYKPPEYRPLSASGRGSPQISEVKKFNDFAQLSDDQKVILPRPVKAAALREMSVKEDSCTICADNVADITLVPCLHRGFCLDCSLQLELCPICRKRISTRRPMSRASSQSSQ